MVPAPSVNVATSPSQMHQTMVQQVHAQVQQVHPQQFVVTPVTAETPLQLGNNEHHETQEHPLVEFYDRAILGKPGHEPSKTFLQKLVDRVRKKHPQAQIQMK